MRAAIIGLGKVAWGYDSGHFTGTKAVSHLSALLQEGLDVVGGADPNLIAREEFSNATGISSYEKIEDLLSLNPEMVSIASPKEFHAEQLASCLEKGVKYIWLEKPATDDSIQAQYLAKQAKQKNARVMVGFQRRYMSSYNALKTKALGSLQAIEITYSLGLETNGSHMLDLLLWLLDGESIKLKGVIKSPIQSVHSRELCPSFLLQSSSGIPINVTGLDVDYHSVDIVVHYCLGRRAVRHGGQTKLFENKCPNPLFPNFYYLSSEDGVQDIRYEVESVFSVMLKDLLYGSKREPISNLNSAALGQALIEKILSECG